MSFVLGYITEPSNVLMQNLAVFNVLLKEDTANFTHIAFIVGPNKTRNNPKLT